MIDKIIKSRRSIKKYSKTKKPNWREIIEGIDLMRYAPMSGNNFSLKVILVHEKDKIQQIAEQCEQSFVGNAEYLVVVCSTRKRTMNAFDERGERYLKQQAGAAIQNFLLKMTEEGLATCWVGHFYDDEIKNILGIPKDIDIETIIPVAYAAEKPKEKRKIDLDNILYFEKYGENQMIKKKKIS